jgi:hypothetical protein
LDAVWEYVKAKDWVEIIVIALVISILARVLAPTVMFGFTRISPPIRSRTASSLREELLNVTKYAENHTLLWIHALNTLIFTVFVSGTLIICLVVGLYWTNEGGKIIVLLSCAIMLLAMFNMVADTLGLLRNVERFSKYRTETEDTLRKLEGRKN